MSSLSSAKSIVTVADPNRSRNGMIAALTCYSVWGFFPILFHQLDGVDSVLVVAHRVVWSLLLVGVILAISGRGAELKGVLRDRPTLVRIAVSAALLAFNWIVYVWAVHDNQLLEASFGYFLTPLANVALGMVLLSERQNRWQWVSIGIAIVAMGIQAVGVGGIPWVALSLAVSFATYGYFRKTVKANSATGLFVETLVLLPLALAYIGFGILREGLGPHADPFQLSMLMLTGPATSFALLLFAYGVQRLRLTTIGMIQYIAPSIQFVLAITLFGEELNTLRLVSFGLIWLSLVVFTLDSLRRRNPPPPTGAVA